MAQHTPQERAAQAALVSRFNAFPPLARRVLLTLAEHGALGAETLINHVGSAAQGHLRALRDAGHVEQVGERFVLSRAGKAMTDAFNAAVAGTEDAR